MRDVCVVCFGAALRVKSVPLLPIRDVTSHIQKKESYLSSRYSRYMKKISPAERQASQVSSVTKARKKHALSISEEKCGLCLPIRRTGG